MNKLVLPSEFLTADLLQMNDVMKWLSLMGAGDVSYDYIILGKGVGSSFCPVNFRWISYCLSATMIATVTDKLIVPPDPEPLDWRPNVEIYSWLMLWRVYIENEKSVSKIFWLPMLKILLPKSIDQPHDRPYYESDFAHYGNGDILDYENKSRAKLTKSFLQEVKEEFRRIPPEIVVEIEKVISVMPTVLEFVNSYVIRSFGV